MIEVLPLVEANFINKALCISPSYTITIKDDLLINWDESYSRPWYDRCKFRRFRVFE